MLAGRRLAVLLAAGCSFSSSTPGQTGPSSVGDATASTGEAGSTVDTTSTREPAPGEASTGDEATGAPPSGSTSSEAASTGEADCGGSGVIVADLLPHSVTEPMRIGLAPDPIGTYAYSPDAHAGTVAFDIDVPCTGDYALWGLVHDDDTDPFDDGGNADSFHVRVDDGPILEWSYGCTTLFQLDAWSYERVQIAGVLDCAVPEDVVVRLDPGAHTVTFRNIEAGEHGEDDPGSVAAIARIALTDIDGHTPDPDLD
jgi:hypothetical protein